VIDIKKLLQPIPGENPSGESLRYSMVYDSIRAARREDDANAPQGIWQTKLKKADWKEVRNTCLDALENRTKDLQIAAWLLESCIHLDGFAGISEGFRVLSSLCTNFWDTLHPEIDLTDPDLRYAPIIWVDEKITLQLKLIAITRSDDERSYTWSDYELAMHQSRAGSPSTAKAPPKKGAPDPSRQLQIAFDASLNLTPNDFLIDLRDQLVNGLDEVERFEAALVERDRTQEGALHQMKALLRTILHFITELLEKRGVDIRFEPFIETEITASDRQESSMAANEQRDYDISGPIRSRAQAYHMLAEAAEYLMKTEPHSPTPYLVKRAVAWGNLTLGELLQQMLRTPGEIGELYRLLGLDEGPSKGKKAEKVEPRD
jgi:type VI secretion system protein ImpA